MENTTDIQNLLTEGEHMSLECKTATKSVPSSVWDTYSAFANTNGGMIRNDDTLLHKAVREAVTNMIIHSDFMVNGLLQIEKYDDRIVLTNPGLLKLPLEQIYSGGESKARNQRMQNMLRMIGFGENLGSGFPLILYAWDEKHWTKPELIEQPELLQVKLVLQLDMGSVPTSSQLRPNFVPTSSQVKDLIIALDTQYHSLGEIMDLLGGTNKTRFRKEYILPAIEQGVIERKYPKTPNHPQQQYRLTEQTKEWKDKEYV